MSTVISRFVLVVAMLAYRPALADQNENTDTNIDPNYIGVGINVFPDYYGSAHAEAAIGPNANYQIAGTERYAQLQGTTLTVNVVDDAAWSFGPMWDYRFSRNHHVRDSIVKKMNTVGGAIESGAFLEYELPLNRKLKNYLLFHGDFINGRNGSEGHCQVQFWQPISSTMISYIGVGTTYGNSKFAKTYFSVSGAHDIALFPSLNGSPYRAVDGLIGRDLQFGVTRYLNKQWLISGSGNYERLVAGAQRSPLVGQRGSANQWLGSASLSYVF